MYNRNEWKHTLEYRLDGIKKPYWSYLGSNKNIAFSMHQDIKYLHSFPVLYIIYMTIVIYVSSFALMLVNELVRILK